MTHDPESIIIGWQQGDRLILAGRIHYIVNKRILGLVLLVGY